MTLYCLNTLTSYIDVNYPCCSESINDSRALIRLMVILKDLTAYLKEP